MTTFAGLVAAIDAADGTADAPTLIQLGADIKFEVPADGSTNSITLPKGKHIAIDGGASRFTLTRTDVLNRLFFIKDGASLRLTNLTADGKNMSGATLFWVGDMDARHPDGAGQLTLGEGVRLTGAVYDYNTNGINIFGTLVMEGDAAITGNGIPQRW